LPLAMFGDILNDPEQSAKRSGLSLIVRQTLTDDASVRKNLGAEAIGFRRKRRRHFSISSKPLMSANWNRAYKARRLRTGSF